MKTRRIHWLRAFECGGLTPLCIFRTWKAPSSRRTPKASRAFTLVEIMIAIAIFSMVLAAIYASWTAILRGASAGQKVAREVQRNRMTMSAVQTALFSVQMFNANISQYWFIADTSGDFAYLSLVSRLPASFPGSGLFGDQVVRRVTFSVEPANGQNQLLLQQKPLLEATNSIEERPYTIVLARDVSLFLLEFWDTRLHDWAGEWLYTNQLPRLVRVTVGIGNRGTSYSPQPEDIISRVVALGGTNIAADIQQPRPGGVPPVPGMPGPPIRRGPDGNVLPTPPGTRPLNPGTSPRPIQPPGRRGAQ
jgi:prepilin-type N-terminal cleavage/methylation domain-containing protein